jgi:hypothetical protein
MPGIINVASFTFGTLYSSIPQKLVLHVVKEAQPKPLELLLWSPDMPLANHSCTVAVESVTPEGTHTKVHNTFFFQRAGYAHLHNPANIHNKTSVIHHN